MELKLSMGKQTFLAQMWNSGAQFHSRENRHFGANGGKSTNTAARIYGWKWCRRSIVERKLTVSGKTDILAQMGNSGTHIDSVKTYILAQIGVGT